MSRRFKIINYLGTFILSFIAVFLITFICNRKYALSLGKLIPFYAIGLIVSGFISATLHELGHLIFGKLSGYDALSFTVWFFRLEKENGKTRFKFCFNLEEAGSTEMVKRKNVDQEKGLKKMTLGGLIFSFISMLIGVLALIFTLPYWAYCILACFLPMGAYYFFGNALPSNEGGAYNDGAVLYGIKRQDKEILVMLSLMAIQSELYVGKSFAQIDEKYYFDLPQLPEDSLNFITLLNYRYNYYLDKGDYDNAKKTTSRLLSLESYMPKSFACVVKADALYNACTFDYNENVADELMYELEKYLNNCQDVTSYRVRLAYIRNVRGETNVAELFYKKSIKLADKAKLKGLKLFETKLIELLA